MKKTNKLSKWCKRTLMLLPVVAVLTFMSCQKDELLPEAATDTATSLHATSLARASAAGSYVITFEDPDVLNYLAGPTSYGENLYSSYTGFDRYVGYYDLPTGLFMMINDPYETYDPDFWNGGIAISQWNDTLTPCYHNQCSVYYKDDSTSTGGYGGSETFAVHFGYYDPENMGDTRSYISFMNEEMGTDNSCVFDYFYVCNSTYATQSMRYGDQCDTTFAERPLDEDHQDWFKLIVEGLDANNNVTGTVEFYLADFRTDFGAPGILDGWHRVDLDTLGHVTALRFDMQGSYHNEYGLVTPAYFCFDNLAIKEFD